MNNWIVIGESSCFADNTFTMATRIANLNDLSRTKDTPRHARHTSLEQNVA